MKKIAFTILLTMVVSGAYGNTPQNIGISEQVGQNIDLELLFADEEGSLVPLKKFFDGRRPVILSLVYYECPTLCTTVLNELTTALKNLKWPVGDEFQIVTISINPREKTETASLKKKAYLDDYGRTDSSAGWHFLTGNEENIKALSGQVGFNYYYDREQNQYIHSAALFILTPNGKISGYLQGTKQRARDLKRTLLTASGGKMGNFIDRLLFFCRHFFGPAKSRADEGNQIAGQKLFVEKGCLSCHSPMETTGAGPTLKGLFGSNVELVDGRKVLADENYIRESIVEPFAKQVKGYPPLMPAFKGTLNEQEINALVAYIRGLK